MHFVLLSLTLFFAPGNGIRSKVVNMPSGVDFKYLEEASGESGLRECTRYEACSVVHNRIWKPNLAERLCRCPDAHECPSQWTKSVDNSSMLLNNRSQLKFCTPITDLEECTDRQLAAVLHGKGDNDNNYLTPYNVTVNCYCSASRYWKVHEYSYGDKDDVSQTYKCVKLKRCESEEFCGNVRPDLFSVYYQCTCPFGHLCVFKNKTKQNAKELFYSGPAFIARCYDFRNGTV